MHRDFLEYTWSLPTLDRRLRYFNIKNNAQEYPNRGSSTDSS